MTTLNLQVAAGADDAWENDSGTDFNSGTSGTQFASHSTNANERFNSGSRFQNVTIASGSTINTASFEINQNGAKSDDIDATVYAEDVDDSANFTTTADVTSRTRTTASVSWTVNNTGAGAEILSGLASVVQEVIDRGGWASGNDLTILVIGDVAATKFMEFHSYESDTTKAAKLDIDYTAGGGGGGGLLPRLGLMGVG